MKKQLITLALLAAILLSGAAAMLTGRTQLSLWERRSLAQWPGFTWKGFTSGSYQESADAASADQFPLRNGFRRLKALFSRHLLGQPDNGGIYVSGGSAAKLEFPLQEASVQRAADKILEIQERYLKNTDVACYYSVVPDKSYYLASAGGYPAMDYDRLLELLQEALSMPYIDITAGLQASSYYRTDPHWRQECLEPVARTLCQTMGAELSWDFTMQQAGTFSGAYAGQSALPLEPDGLFYWAGGCLENSSVYDPVTGLTSPVYALEKAQGRDPYDLFLGGAAPIQVLENPNAGEARELVIFRDSFGSSLAPVLLGAYSKITLVDLRYLDSSLLGDYLTFYRQDVLFLYSTLVLNHGEILK